jgi:hypothetical protein
VLSRFDDKAIDNVKIERAADILDGVADGGKPGRRFGYTRAYGAWSWGVTYANAHLTDGRLTRRAIEKYRIGPQECAALVAVGAWDEVDGGYQIHDFLDWNPSAAAVKAKQSKDRDRKRKAAGYRPEGGDDSARNPDGIQPDSNGTAYTRAGAPAGLGRAGTGMDQPTSSDDPGEHERVPPGLVKLTAAGLIAAWNNLVAAHRPFVPVTATDHHSVHAAIRRQPDFAWWITVLEKVAASDFLSGKVALRDGRTWVADFWWVLDHAEQIHAGRHDNREAPAAPPKDAREVFQRARQRTADTNLDVLMG